MPKKAELRLIRRLTPDETKQPGTLQFLAFRLDIETRKEEGLIVVDGPIELVQASGETGEEAREDYTESFKALIDFHIHEGTHEAFFSRHFKGSYKQLVCNFEEEPDAEDIISMGIPVWSPNDYAAKRY